MRLGIRGKISPTLVSKARLVESDMSRFHMPVNGIAVLPGWNGRSVLISRGDCICLRIESRQDPINLSQLNCFRHLFAQRADREPNVLLFALRVQKDHFTDHGGCHHGDFAEVQHQRGFLHLTEDASQFHPRPMDVIFADNLRCANPGNSNSVF